MYCVCLLNVYLIIKCVDPNIKILKEEIAMKDNILNHCEIYVKLGEIIVQIYQKYLQVLIQQLGYIAQIWDDVNIL